MSGTSDQHSLATGSTEGAGHGPNEESALSLAPEVIESPHAEEGDQVGSTPTPSEHARHSSGEEHATPPSPPFDGLPQKAASSVGSERSGHTDIKSTPPDAATRSPMSSSASVRTSSRHDAPMLTNSVIAHTEAAAEAVLGVIEEAVADANARRPPLDASAYAHVRLYATEADRRSHAVCMHYVGLLEERRDRAAREAALQQARQLLVGMVHQR